MHASTCGTVSRLRVRPCVAGLHSPWSQPLAPPAPRRIAPPVRQLRSYYCWVRLPAFVHHRLSVSLPDADQKRDCPGRTRDLPSSDAILLRVICSSTPAGRAWPRLAALSMLRSTLCTVSAPATYPLRGSITHPTQPLCTLRGRRRRRLTQHSLPGCLLSITWVGLSPTDRASFAWRLRRVGPCVTSTSGRPAIGGGAVLTAASHQKERRGRKAAPFLFCPTKSWKFTPPFLSGAGTWRRALPDPSRS